MITGFRGDPVGSLRAVRAAAAPAARGRQLAEATAKNRLLVARTAVAARLPPREALVDYLAGRGIFAAFSRADLTTHIAATLRPNGAEGAGATGSSPAA